MDLIATSAFGLESVVSRELHDLGYDAKPSQPGRIRFKGDAAAVCRANLWLRAADRVLIRLGTFQATDFGRLFDGTFALPWHEWIPPEAEFPVLGRSIKSQLSSVPACQKIVKKAIVEKLRATYATSELPETGPRVTAEVALLKDMATLTLDTTGTGLHKRGYRTLVGAAPLKETLAAAMVLLSFWRPGRPFVDPFCGTGTIPIEAALIGRNMAPGLRRAYAAEAWPAIPGELWANAREEARQVAHPPLEERIVGTDVDDQSLSLARHHAQKAGVADDIHFQQRAFSELSSKKDFGCVICNPPYGRRIGEEAELRELYQTMPEVLRRLPTWSHYLLTAYPELEKLLGQKADRRRKLYNARLECTYYQFHGPKPGKVPVACGKAEGDALAETKIGTVPPKNLPAFGGLLPEATRQAEEFGNRLAKRSRHLRRWPTRRGITCYRLYERDVPEVPLVVDRYENYLHITEYERPHERSPAQHADWLDLMVRTASEVIEIPKENVFLKRRRRQRGDLQYERYAEQQRTVVVSEGGLRFLVNLSDYIDTGLFLDHRITRSLVREEAHDKRFLNLFCYTGAFSVYAAAGGARETTSVDLSNTYLDWAKKNMTMNGFSGPEHRFVRDDAIGFLESHPRKPIYDMAMVDPPTFSNSKRTEDFWEVQRDHVALLNRLLERMVPGGVIYFSTNFRRFKFDEDHIEGAAPREISRQTVPEDFRNRRIHRCWRMVRLPES